MNQEKIHPDWRSARAFRELIVQWRQNCIIAAVNGCFDFGLHPGHIATLEYPKKISWMRNADVDVKTVVLLNSDESIRRIKGETRPCFTFEVRAAVLAALSCVDMVLGFDQDKPEEAIHNICPHWLVKGMDYYGQDVPGGRFVCARGGAVIFAPNIPGYSTTGMLERFNIKRAG